MTARLAMVTAFPERHDVVRGGVEGVAHSLVTGLRNHGDLEIHVLAPSRRRDDWQETRGDIQIHWLGQSILPGFLDYWTFQRQRVQRLLRRLQPAITHFQGLAGWAMDYRQPAVLTVHGIAERDVMFTGTPLRRVQSRIIGAAERAGRSTAIDKIIISPFVRQSIGDQLGGRLWDIENPVSEEFFRVTRARMTSRVLYVGRISERKNVLGLLRVFQLVRSRVPNATLRLAGSPDSHAFLRGCQAFVERNELADCVEFVGNLDRSRLLSELAEASCLALLSHQETAPMVVGEAMAAGIPVIASRVCGLPHMIDDGRTGYLCEPRDEAHAVRCLATLLTEAGENLAMGQRARHVAKQRFHVDAIARRTQDVYRAAIEAGRSA